MTTLPRIPLPSDSSVPKYGTPIDVAVAAFAVAARRDQVLDPAIIELVRLRCAGHHDCRLCGSLRTTGSGLDEESIAKIADYENSDLTERQKVALRLTDAMIIDPRIAPELTSTVRENFSPREIAELLLDVVKFSQQKASVALRIEPAPREGLTALDVAPDGRGRIGAAIP